MKLRFTWLAVCLFVLLTSPFAQRQMERLSRGVVAVRSGSNIFISWRLLGLDPAGIGFNVYRSANNGAAVKLNSTVLTAGTNYTDNTATLTVSNAYYVRPVINGVEQTASSSYKLEANTESKPCFTVPLKAGNRIHFVWVGDLDGDGDYEFIVDRLDYTAGNCKIEAYKRDGTFLWDVDYGVNSTNMDNISPGSSTIDVGNWDGVTVYDLDGDGKAEVITKIANGVKFGNGATWSHSDNDRQWLAILNGQTGALKSYVSLPLDFYSAGSLACSLGIGYLDGKTPSVVGKFKNRNADGSFNLMIAAFQYSGSNTTLQWKWIRNVSAADGHQIRIIDVDGNGTDEICDIGYCLNGDGTLRYNLTPQGIIHGDRTQIGKLDPNRAGMQGYAVQQDNPSGLLEYYYDASNGTILWKHTGGVADVGRGEAGDVDPRYSGYEVWSYSGMYNGPSNTQFTAAQVNPYPNLRIWWDGDVLSENYHKNVIEKWNYTSATVGRVVTCYHYDGAMDSDRDVPMFYGDILGDWREEVVMCNADYSKLVVFTTDIPSTTRLYTLAHNPAYRNCMTIKGYMQSHLTDYYLGYDMTTPAKPNIYYASGTAPVVSSTSTLTVNSAVSVAKTVETGAASDFSVYPNPLQGSTLHIQMAVKEASHLYFSVTDVKGNLVFEKKLGYVQKGNYIDQVTIGTHMPPGSYVAGIRSQGGTLTKTFIRL